MNEPLQEWADAHKPPAANGWEPGYWNHIMFVRDKVAGTLCEEADHTFEELCELVKVVGTHTSKSILLPVFGIDWKRGVQFTIRYNFYNWAISVKSQKPIAWDFDGLFARGDVELYHEGFPADHVFGSYNQDPTQFTVSLWGGNYDLYTFFYLLKRQFPAAREA